MKLIWIAGAVVAATSIAGAQTRSQTPSPTSGAQPLPNGGNQTVLVTGCITQADTPNASPTSFALTGARMSNDSPTGTALPDAEDTRSTPAGRVAAGSPAAGLRYMLESTSTNLATHLGHRVEVSGRVEAAAGTQPGANATGESLAKFKVESVRMIAMTCEAH